MAVETGADAIGMIFAPSVRRITESAAKHIAEELPPFITPVGVFVNPSRDEIARARAIFPDLVIQLQLPIANALVDSSGRALPRTRFYVPGSILSMRVDTTAALAQGLRPITDFYYDNAEAFRLLPAAESRGVKRVVWIDNPTPLRSGWAWGQRYLNGVTEVLQAPVGRGMLVLYGADPYFRSQPHGTFKLLFNALLYRNTLGD